MCTKHKKIMHHPNKGLCKEKKVQKSEITYYGSGVGEVGPGLALNFFFFNPRIMCRPLLKVVGYYDLSVLSMSVINGFPKKKFGCGWVG